MAENSNNRLLLEIDKARKELNRNLLNPLIPELSLDDLKPVLGMVAAVRGEYLKALFDIANSVDQKPPSAEQVATLKQLRETYQEMVSAAQALESAIQHNYLDVKGREAPLNP